MRHFSPMIQTSNAYQQNFAQQHRFDLQKCTLTGFKPGTSLSEEYAMPPGLSVSLFQLRS
jgi:hypothetical protein